MKPVFQSLVRGITCPAIILLFLINSNLFSQVTIKERVEINPGGDIKTNSFTRGYTPCGPYIQNTEADHYWQVVWGGYWAPLDPSQQLFGLSSLFGYGLFDSYDVEIIEGAEHCTLAQPVPIPDIENGWTHEPLNVTELEGLAKAQLTGRGTWMFFDCVPRVWDDTTHLQLLILYDYIEEDEAVVTYSIYCHETMQKKYFHTLIRRRDYVFEEFTSPIRIPHAELEGCTPEAIPVFCSSLDTSQWYEDYDCKGIWDFHAGGGISDDVKFSASIMEGGEYGTLTYTEGDNVFTGEALTNLDYSNFDNVGFLADGEEPEDTGIVKIHVSSTDPSIPPEDLYLNIVPNPTYPLRVTFEPSELEPGDTAVIKLEKRVSEYPNFNPETVEYEDFPEDQLFDLILTKGKEQGTIYSEAYQDTADEFEDMLIGFKLIAKDSIEVDSVFEISLRVSAYIPGIDEGGGACSALPGDKNTKRSQEISLLSNIINKTSSQLTPDIGVIDKLKNLNDTKAGIMTYYNPINGGEVIGIGKVWINKKKELDHFEITIIPDTLAEKDTIAFTEKATLLIQAKDSSDNNIEFNNDTLLTFKVETNENYGTFINKNGDTLKTTPVEIKDIRYEDANKGYIKFAAVKQNPDSVVKCLIKVVLQDDTTKTGERVAVVLEQTSKIVLQGTNVIQPIITSRAYDPEERTYMNNINAENRIHFRIKHTRGGKKVEFHRFRLSTNYLNRSGGHDHTNRRPDIAFTYQRRVRGVLDTFNISTERARRQNYGSFYSYNSGQTFSVDSIRGMFYERSNQDTVSRFEYIASIWGDTMKISLKSLSNSLLKDSVLIIERVPDLQLLPDNQFYIKVGGTCNHHGPRDDNNFPNCRTPDNNHYGTQSLTTAIQNVAADYINLHPGVRIRINDMSLPFGGKFDIEGLWMGSHAEHRIGKNADISSLGINQNNQHIDLDINEMRIIIRFRTDMDALFHDGHFHIYTR